MSGAVDAADDNTLNLPAKLKEISTEALEHGYLSVWHIYICRLHR